MESHFVHFVLRLVSRRRVMVVAVLVLKNVVQDFLENGQAASEDNVGKLTAAKNPPLHVFKLDILKSKNLLCVMISNCCSLHLADFHLHDVF